MMMVKKIVQDIEWSINNGFDTSFLRRKKLLMLRKDKSEELQLKILLLLVHPKVVFHSAFR